MERWMKPEEYLEELKKELNNPEEYRVEGFYNFHEEENKFTGLFVIDTNGKIVGEIRDPNSVCSKHIAKGEIKHFDDIVLMNFVKIPIDLLANIYYSLRKSDDNKKFEGSYNGRWQFNEPVIKLDLSGLDPEIGNETQMTLYKNSAPSSNPYRESITAI